MLKLNRHLELDKIFWFVDVEHVTQKRQPEFLIVSAFALHILPLRDEIFNVQSENLLPRRL